MAAFHVGIVGDGSSAVNLTDALLNAWDQVPPSQPINITLFGAAEPHYVGKGFAYGPVAGKHGNFTEPVNKGHADYTREKGAFEAFRNLRCPHQRIFHPERAHRGFIGSLQHERWQEALQRGLPDVEVAYRRGRAVGLEGAYSQRRIVTAEGHVSSPLDHVVLAVGDTVSNRFHAAAERFPGRVFATPYHAIDKIIAEGNHPNAHVLALGTRSSFVDLVNALAERKFRGRITGVSSTGRTSWPVTADTESYAPVFLNGEASFSSARDVLSALAAELDYACRERDAYVPGDLIENIRHQAQAGDPGRIVWDFNVEPERATAGHLTYHQAAQSVDWERIYKNLPEAERPLFTRSLGDFILYNRVNCVVRDDFNAFANNLRSERVQLLRNGFRDRDIARALSGKLNIGLRDGGTIKEVDCIVNCAGGPASAMEQLAQQPLLRQLSAERLITPQPAGGTGFISHADDISLIGAQGREFPFSSIGIESYGRQIEALAPQLAVKIRQHGANGAAGGRLFIEERKLRHG